MYVRFRLHTLLSVIKNQIVVKLQSTTVHIYGSAKLCSTSLGYYFKSKVCQSVHHHTIQINQPTRCNNFPILLLDV